MSLIKFKKGIFIESYKNTAQLAAVPMTLPSRVYIPMTQSSKSPCKPLVRPGDRVLVGQVIGDSRLESSVPVHSSVSGVVAAVEYRPSQLGMDDLHVVIDTDGKQTLSPSVVPPVISSREDFLRAVRSCGLAGLGGAGFPTALKFSAPEGSIHTLIINGAECEPFVTSDYRSMLAYARDIVAGSASILQWLGIPKCIFAIGGDKKDAADQFKELTSGSSAFQTVLLPRLFPSGEETLVVREAAGVTLKEGSLPSDEGFLVVNCTTVLKLQQYLMTGMPLISRTVTADGDAVKNPMNVEVPIGTLISDLLEFCGGSEKPLQKIIAGGPLTGTALPSDQLPIIKTNNAILFFTAMHSARDKETACINCGRCLESCPQGLFPALLYKLWMQKDLQGLKDNHISACIGCGSCSFRCPARKPLSLELSMAKEALSEK